MNRQMLDCLSSDQQYESSDNLLFVNDVSPVVTSQNYSLVSDYTHVEGCLEDSAQDLATSFHASYTVDRSAIRACRDDGPYTLANFVCLYEHQELT